MFVFLLVGWCCLIDLQLRIWIYSLRLLSWMSLRLWCWEWHVSHGFGCLLLQLGNYCIFSFVVVFAAIAFKYRLHFGRWNRRHWGFLNVVHFDLQYAFVLAIYFWMLYHHFLRARILNLLRGWCWRSWFCQIQRIQSFILAIFFSFLLDLSLMFTLSTIHKLYL